MYQNEGIDKIKIVLSPFFVNPIMKGKRHIDPHNKLVPHYFGEMVVISIHHEYFNYFFDFKTNIVNAIIDLIRIGFIRFDDSLLAQMFVYANIDWFVLYVQEVEFFFDLKVESITIDEEELDQNIPSENKILNDYEGTLYSKDYKRGKIHSVLAIYDRAKKIKKDNQISHKEIEANPFKKRLEFRLCRNNCDYLNIENFYGTYSDIIKMYIPLLAIYFHNLLCGTVFIDSKDNKNLMKIYDLSKKGSSRYRGKLKKSEKIDLARIYGKDQDAEFRMKMMILRAWLLENENKENQLVS